MKQDAIQAVAEWETEWELTKIPTMPQSPDLTPARSAGKGVNNYSDDSNAADKESISSEVWLSSKVPAEPVIVALGSGDNKTESEISKGTDPTVEKSSKSEANEEDQKWKTSKGDQVAEIQAAGKFESSALQGGAWVNDENNPADRMTKPRSIKEPSADKIWQRRPEFL